MKGCKEQYDIMRSCINVERTNLVKREEYLRNAVHGIQEKMEENPIKIENKQEEEKKIYI